MKISVSFMLNNKKVSVKCEPNKRLIDVLRDDLNLTGIKEGCGIGECGACTVLLNDEAVNGCLIMIGQVEGTNIVTVEGLTHNNELSKLQKNFLKFGAVQCGFCTSGMLLSATGLMNRNNQPDENEIKESISGNLCRCTGYKQIIDAIKNTSDECDNNS